MKSKLLLIVSLIALSFFAFKPLSDVYAKTKCVPLDEVEDKDQLPEIIEACEQKTEELAAEKQSLSKEIETANNQINLTELRIQNSLSQLAAKESEIQKLSGDIENLKTRILKLGDSIKFQENVLRERMRSRYMSLETSPLIVIFGSDTLDKLIQKTEYLKIMELQDHKLLVQMNETKNAYNVQKDLFVDQKEKEEKLKAQIQAEKSNLEAYKSQLSDQKAQKQKLLEETQSDEKKYQERLSQARAELLAIEGVVASINFKNGEKVEKGEAIAVMGNSGAPDCSTGPHLHFEVRRSGQLVNAENYLKSKEVFVYDYSDGYKNIGKGDWSWPMKSPIINQRYGDTPWSWRYSGGVHTGIDMESSDTLIYAPEDGTLIKSTQGCYNSTIKYAAIDHGDGIVSYYLHIK